MSDVNNSYNDKIWSSSLIITTNSDGTKSLTEEELDQMVTQIYGEFPYGINKTKIPLTNMLKKIL